MKHILRYGTNADQDYFSDFESCYDIVAINASMAAFAPNALALFVAKKTPEKEFFVDPMTHLFQHNKGLISSEKKVAIDESEKTPIKKSIAKLINEYARPVDGFTDDEGDANYTLLREKIRATEIDRAFYKKFTEGVLNFQRHLVPEERASDYADYINYANKSVGESEKINFNHKPRFLVAPYFYLQSNDGWVDKNIALLEESITLKGDEEIYAQLVISKRLFDKSVAEEGESDLDKIIARYAAMDVSGYLVWVDDYAEHAEFSKSLTKYARFLQGLKVGGTKKTYVLYGSYFSTMLGHESILIADAITHGLEYGESRAVVPVGGGIPRAKFYLPKLHKRVDFPDMVELLKEKEIDTKAKYHQEICDCATCRGVIKSNRVLDDFTEAFGQTKSTTIKRGERIVTLSFSTKETKDLSLQHYLWAKNAEFKSLGTKTPAQIVAELRSTALEYAGYLDGSYTAHLEEWAGAIEEISAPVTVGAIPE